jgi:hypothetical protein
MEMGCNIAQTILTARLVQQLVNAQVWDRPHLVKALRTAQYSLLGINKWVYPGSSDPDLTRPLALQRILFSLSSCDSKGMNNV